MKLPLKFYLLKCIAEQSSPSTYKDLLPLVQKEYANERQSNKKNIINHLEAFAITGMTTVDDAFEENGELYMSYEISDYGKNLMEKYVKG